MKQVLLNLKNGQTSMTEVPVPQVRPGCLLIKSSRSLISSGTERMLTEFGRANLIEKARKQPEKVKQVIEKMKRDGLYATLQSVYTKLDELLPLGYCNVGQVFALGEGASNYSIGDRVVSNGYHAGVVNVPQHLCAKIPAVVEDDSAAFTVLAAIALQGIRLLKPTFGECFSVVGLGPIGLLAVQLLRAAGCEVIGIDYDKKRLKLAAQYGASTIDLAGDINQIESSLVLTNGRGIDGALITASTKSSEPVSQAAHMCRKRGRIVLTGVTGLEINRSDFYEKEISFQVSCSYGPGRYDSEYEDKGHDYPVGYVRWTEQRNFCAVLDAMKNGSINTSRLISARYNINDAEKAYDQLMTDKACLGILFDYPNSSKDTQAEQQTIRILPPYARKRGSLGAIGFIGAGSYARSVLIPAFKRANATLKTIVSPGGVSAAHMAKKHGFDVASTNISEVMVDQDIDTVVIASRHDSHAYLVKEALKAGKNVFVEKPLCLAEQELVEIEAVYKEASNEKSCPLLMVGFNRRFSPHVKAARNLLAPIGQSKSMIMTVNAGHVPPNHWIQDPLVGGGRIVGEVCHFVDLLRFLAGSQICDYYLSRSSNGRSSSQSNDNVIINLGFKDGSIGTIQYLINGHNSFPKERLEIFCDGKILQLDNYRRLSGFGWNSFRRKKTWRQDKGQRECVSDFMSRVASGEPTAISPEEIFEVSRVTLGLSAMARKT